MGLWCWQFLSFLSARGFLLILVHGEGRRAAAIPFVLRDAGPRVSGSLS